MSKNSDKRTAIHRQQIQQRQGHLGLFPLNYVANVGKSEKAQRLASSEFNPLQLIC